jgi:hypothetical protein
MFGAVPLFTLLDDLMRGQQNPSDPLGLIRVGVVAISAFFLWVGFQSWRGTRPLLVCATGISFVSGGKRITTVDWAEIRQLARGRYRSQVDFKTIELVRLWDGKAAIRISSTICEFDELLRIIDERTAGRREIQRLAYSGNIPRRLPVEQR